MGCFKAEGVIVRELENMTIIFWDKQSIYVYPKDEEFGIIFHRWFAPAGYKNWGDFRRKVLRWKNPTIYRIYQIADRYEVVAQRTARRLNLNKVKIIKRG